MTDTKLPPIPVSIAEYFGVIGGSDYDHHTWTWSDRAEYQRARADAAMARLRVAVEAFERIRFTSSPSPISKTHFDMADDSLRLIGPLPDVSP